MYGASKPIVTSSFSMRRMWRPPSNSVLRNALHGADRVLGKVGIIHRISVVGAEISVRHAMPFEMGNEPRLQRIARMVRGDDDAHNAILVMWNHYI
jgi:hypothetical protein